jgi:hypothetical protein
MTSIDARATPSAHANGARGFLANRLLPTALLLLFAAQCAWFLRTQSLTIDEPSHIISGLNAWRLGSFKEHDDNPPLLRLWLTLPVRGEQWQIEGMHSFAITGIRPDPEALAMRVRAMNVLLGIAMGVVLWRAARWLFSAGAANVALALYAFSPSMIGNFALATHDGAAALMTLVVAWQWVRWREQPTWRRTVGLGLLLGLHLMAKFSALPTFALAVALALVCKPEGWTLRPQAWNWGRAAAMVAMAFIVVWGSYFFHVSRAELRDGRLTMNFPNYPKDLDGSVAVRMNATLYVPAAEMLTGIVNMMQNSWRGYSAYLLGEYYTGGRAAFFPTVIALKWPPLVLLLALAGGATALRRRIALTRGFGLMLLFPALYLALAMASNMNFGDRHILPVYPFLLLLAAGVWRVARHKRLYALLAVALAVLNAADALRYAPDYLSYFNPLVRSETAWQLLTDSNVDWNQGLLALRDYERAHPDEATYVAYLGSVHPSTYGLRSRRFGEDERPAGTVVVSAGMLNGYKLDRHDAFRWVLRYPRKAILGHVLHVFEVPEGAEPAGTRPEGEAEKK